MVRRSFTAVIEKNSTFTADFVTEPYEAGWASEARWFVRAVEFGGRDTVLRVTPQISPDGLFWCDEGAGPMVISEAGLVSFPMHNFGHWLRLRGEVPGHEPSVKVMIYLALKE